MRSALSMVGALVLCTASLGQSSCSTSDRPTEHYATYEELQRHGGFDAAWFPVYLPAEAEDITVARDIDLNTSWLRFRLRRPQLEEFTYGLSSSKTVEFPGRPPNAENWWASELCRPNEYDDSLSRKFIVVDEMDVGSRHGSSISRRAYFAIDPLSGIVYYWDLRY
jgi:hypothetical protein